MAYKSSVPETKLMRSGISDTVLTDDHIGSQALIFQNHWLLPRPSSAVQDKDTIMSDDV